MLVGLQCYHKIVLVRLIEIATLLIHLIKGKGHLFVESEFSSFIGRSIPREDFLKVSGPYDPPLLS